LEFVIFNERYKIKKRNYKFHANYDRETNGIIYATARLDYYMTF